MVGPWDNDPILSKEEQVPPAVAEPLVETKPPVPSELDHPMLTTDGRNKWM